MASEGSWSVASTAVFALCCTHSSADITCSWPVNGKFTPQQALLYNAVLDAHRSVIAAMAPGVSWPELHSLAYRKILGGWQLVGCCR